MTCGTVTAGVDDTWVGPGGRAPNGSSGGCLFTPVGVDRSRQSGASATGKSSARLLCYVDCVDRVETRETVVCSRTHSLLIIKVANT